MIIINNGKLRRVKQYRIFYLFLLPAIAVSIIFQYRPMLGIIMAFQDYDVVKGFWGSPFVGFTHFKEFLTDPYFFNAVKNTLGINGFAILVGYPLPIIFSLFIFSMRDSIFKRVSQTISYMPHFISWVVVSSLVYRILDQETGLVNILLVKLGLENIPFMSTPQYFWGICIITGVWKELGFLTIIYLAALSAIPTDQYEAGDIDGATGFQKLIFITIPGISTTMALVLVFTLGTLVNTNGYFVMVPFDAIFNLRNPMISDTSNTLDYYIYQRGVVFLNYSYSAAIGITQSIIAFIMVLGGNKISKKVQGYGAF